MTTLEPASVALKLAFLAVLYLFLLWVVRSAWKDLRSTRDAGLAPASLRRRRARAAPAATDVDATGLHRAGEPVLGHGGAADGEPRLVVEHAAGHPDGIAYSLEHGATLGRGDVEIRLEDPFASTRHARIERQGSVLVSRTSARRTAPTSTRSRSTGPQPLHHGDRIRIGDSELDLPSGLTSPMLRVAEHFEKSDTGRQRRANEDSFFVRAPLFVVADGMGGAQAGEVASRLAAEAFAGGLPDDGTPEQRLEVRVRDANTRIHEVSQEDRALNGMGTTLTAAYLDGDELSLAHVGDSRAYLLRDGELTRLTRDHTLVDELVRRGELTEQEAAEHPQRSIITRALGPEPDIDIDLHTHRMQAGDVLLLCSDGLTGMIGEDEVAEILSGVGEPGDAGRALVDAANEAGGRDNITVVLFRLEEVGVRRIASGRSAGWRG